MTTINRVRDRNNLDVQWPSHELIDMLEFEMKVRGRVAEYLKQGG